MIIRHVQFIKIFKLIVGMFIGVNVTVAQDVHLSHIHASPTYLNPAMTGLFRHDVRLIANYRSQWGNFTNGYQSFMASADMKLANGITDEDDLAVGIQLVGDKAGDLNYRTISGSLSASYLKSLDQYGGHFLSFGVQSGFVQRSVDLTAAEFQEDDPFAFGDNFMNNITYWDLSMGVAWFYPIDERGSFSYLGVSAAHLNQAMVSHQKREEHFDQGTTLHTKFTVHGGASWRIDNFTTLKPSFIYMSQGPHKEFNLGSYVKLTKETHAYYTSDYAFMVGAWFRWSLNNGVFHRDAIVGSVRYDYYNHVFALSYDFNVSDLTKATHLQGGPELSYIYYIDRRRDKKRNFKVKCPEF